MIYKIIVELEAFNDLQNIKKYITNQDTKSKANTFISELKKQIKTLSQMPQRCRKSHYTDDETMHDLIFKKYTIVFKITDNKVHILTVFNQNKPSAKL